MPHNIIHLLDVVALTADLADKGLLRGQVGTVVEALGSGAFEIEFSDDQGRSYGQFAIKGDDLLVLRYQPRRAA